MGVEQFPPASDGGEQHPEAPTTPLAASSSEDAATVAQPAGETVQQPASSSAEDPTPNPTPNPTGQPPLIAGMVGQTWVAPPPPPKASSTRSAQIKTAVIAVAATAIIVGGGFALASSLGDDSSSSTSGSSTSDEYGRGGDAMPGYGDMQGDMGGMGGGGGEPGGTSMSLTDALHGDFTVADDSGNYVTQRYQTGEVTAVTTTSITISSEDGYSQTYVVEDETALADIETGHTVTVLATVSDSTATITVISDSDLTSSDQQMPDRGTESGEATAEATGQVG